MKGTGVGGRLTREDVRNIWRKPGAGRSKSAQP
ncbi:hypothetical protein CJ430_31770 [Klebsiella pneumoniae]|nr:hypothetical protein CJ430_31770 [Klebsiella pneumoniae]